jgi:queuine/archaeosine tRNA-ribosyltransferase
MINGDKDVFEKFDDINYIPVIASLITFAKPQNFINGEAVTFFQNNSIFKYPKHLVNPFHTEKDYEELFNNGSMLPSLSFADSGGLQELLLKGLVKTPEEILQWQEKYCDVGFALDKIPFNTDNANNVGWTFDEVNFDKCAQITKERIEAALKVRKEWKGFKYYAIIQGIDYKMYKRWKDIIEVKGIDGWCCKSPTNSPANLAETAVFVLLNLDKPVHFLGIGQLTKSIILYYAKRYYKHPFSFDSSSYDSGAQYRRYNLPFYFNGFDVIKSEKGKYSMTNFSDFCGCPACKVLSSIINNPDAEKYIGYLISLHNVIQNIYIFKYLDNIYKDGDKLRDFVKNYFKENTANRLLDCFDFIDDCMKHGYDAGKKKWAHIFQEQKKTTKQQTLF